MPENNLMVDVQNVTKIYNGKMVANNGISLTVGKGEIVGLLGHNGAGKTTLVNQILGLTKPTSGKITVFRGIYYRQAGTRAFLMLRTTTIPVIAWRALAYESC